MYRYSVITFQKSAAVHLARHCPSTRTERIFMDWLWWILQGLPFTHLVSYCNLTVLVKIPVLSVQNLATQASKYRKLPHSKFEVLDKKKLLVHMYIVKNTTIFLIVHLLLLRYNYMFWPSVLATFRLYMKHLTLSYIYT